MPKMARRRREKIVAEELAKHVEMRLTAPEAITEPRPAPEPVAVNVSRGNAWELCGPWESSCCKFAGLGGFERAARPEEPVTKPERTVIRAAYRILAKTNELYATVPSDETVDAYVRKIKAAGAAVIGLSWERAARVVSGKIAPEALLVKGSRGGGRPANPLAKINQLQTKAAKLRAPLQAVEAAIVNLEAANV
jgi:hypothetical protein